MKLGSEIQGLKIDLLLLGIILILKTRGRAVKT
jgi:hypothetical protein